MADHPKVAAGRFLSDRDRAALKRERKLRNRRRRQRKFLSMLILIWGNAVLVFMIAGNRIDSRYAVVFAAVFSVYLGYKLGIA